MGPMEMATANLLLSFWLVGGFILLLFLEREKSTKSKVTSISSLQPLARSQEDVQIEPSVEFEWHQRVPIDPEATPRKAA